MNTMRYYTKKKLIQSKQKTEKNSVYYNLISQTNQKTYHEVLGLTMFLLDFLCWYCDFFNLKSYSSVQAWNDNLKHFVVDAASTVYPYGCPVDRRLSAKKSFSSSSFLFSLCTAYLLVLCFSVEKTYRIFHARQKRMHRLHHLW